MLEGSRGHFCDPQYWLGVALLSAREEGTLLVSVPLSAIESTLHSANKVY